MTETRSRVVAIGEVMVELSRGDDGRFSLAYGGDTFNTAVYLARCGVDVGYATALGDDRYSEGILQLASAESVAVDTVIRVPDRMPGLYLIETDEKGERDFSYWRDTSPARDLFELPQWSALSQRLLDARMLYFSGITLSLYSNTGLGRFLATLEIARDKGVTIAFDSNFRPRGWRGDAARARTVYAEALKRTDIALPSFDDEAALWGDGAPRATIERLRSFGIQEIVVKNGPGDVVIGSKEAVSEVPVSQTVKVVDTTAAGDSFNAAYLAARLRGDDMAAAAAAGHALAGEVVQHRGAIIARAQRVMH